MENTHAQKVIEESTKSHLDDINDEIKRLQNQLGEGRIILKDNRIYKRTKIHKIHPYWIEYVKNGSLHDLMIEKIKRIEIGREIQKVIVFDKKNKPVII